MVFLFLVILLGLLKRHIYTDVTFYVCVCEWLNPISVEPLGFSLMHGSDIFTVNFPALFFWVTCHHFMLVYVMGAYGLFGWLFQGKDMSSMYWVCMCGVDNGLKGVCSDNWMSWGFGSACFSNVMFPFFMINAFAKLLFSPSSLPPYLIPSPPDFFPSPFSFFLFSLSSSTASSSPHPSYPSSGSWQSGSSS